MKNKRGQMEMAQQPVEKKSKWWLWLIVIIILIAIGVGIYFWLGGGDSGSIIGGGNSVPSPPALPE